MKITTRMEKIKGVERAEWNWKAQELIIYKKKNQNQKKINGGGKK